MKSTKNSPATRTRRPFSIVFAKSWTRLAAILMILATLTTAGFSATSSAGSLNKIIFGGSGSGETSPDSGDGLKAVATGVMAMLGSVPQATPTPTLLNARRGHTATRLDNGDVLVAGGDEHGTAEIFYAGNGTFGPTSGALNVPRTNAGAVKLSGNRVLIVGGQGVATDGTKAADTAEIYDNGSFTLVPTGLDAERVGATATDLGNGTILIAGGDEAGSAEIFDGASFTAVGNMTSPRSMHSAALLPGGRVLIVGGRDATGGALASAEIFDAATSAFSTVGNDMKVARVRAHLRVLFDDKVQIIGGSDDGSMEVYDPLIDTIGAYAHVLPESDTCAGLHTHVMASQTRAALFRNGQADPLLDRTGHTITELPGTNRALVAGGANSGGSALNSFSLLSSSPSTITTDKLDYAPGEVATITGRDFQPGETVRVKIHEDPHTPQERGFDITADTNGNFSGTYLVQDYDLDMKFIVGARGLTSGWTAQTTFTDANPQSVALNPNSVTVVQGNSAVYSADVVMGGNTTTCTVTLSVTTALPAGASASFSGGANPFTTTNVNFSRTLTISTTNATPVGTHQFTVQATRGSNCQGNGNFTAVGTLIVTSGNVAPTIAVNNATVTVDEGQTAINAGTYTDADAGNNVTITASAGTITKTGTNTGTWSWSLTNATTSQTVTVTANDGNGGTAQTTFSLAVKPLTTLSVVPATGTYGGTVNLSATLTQTTGGAAVSGKTISFTLNGSSVGTATTNASGVATLSSASLSGINAGTYANGVAASFAGDAGFAASNGSNSLTVTPKTVTPSVTANNKTYDATTTATLSSQTLSGVLAADTANVSLSVGAANFSDKNVGNGKTVTATGLALTGSAAGNYQLSSTTATTTADITAATVTGSFTANDKTYDATTAATIATRSLSGVIGGDSVSLAGGAATFDTKNVGTDKTVTGTGFTLSGADAGNYALASTTLTATADINAASLTGSFTANDKTYDGTASATIATRSLSGVLGSDSVNLSGGTATFSDKNVGNGKTVTGAGFTLSGADAGNYTLSGVGTTTADITPATLTGSFTANDRTYDGTTGAIIATRSLSGVISPDVVSLTGGAASFADKNVGAGKTVTGTGFTLSGADAGNYVLASATLNTTADITPASLTGSFTAASKTYDGTASASITGRSLAGVIGGDDVSLSGGAATFSDKNVGSGKVVTGTGFSLAGADAGNYALASTTLTSSADITALHITGSFTAGDKTYDGTTAANVLTRSLVGAVGGDDVSLAGGTATFADKHAGSGKPVTLTGASLAGADAGNYVLDSVSAATANITPRALTVSATGVNKIYDGTTNATVTLSDDRVSGDTLTASYTGASFADKNVGSGKTISVTGISISGADAANYALSNTTANAAADITQRSLTVTATGVNREYDGTTNAAVTLSDDRIGGDVLSASYASASFADKNVGAAKTISVSGISISGTDAGNYSLANTTASAAADITAKAVTVTATGVNKTYDGTTNATVTLSPAGVVSGDDVSASYTGASFADKHVGNGKTVSVSGISLGGADAGNYTFNTTASTTADITPLTITGSFTAANKIYDGTTAATISTRSVSGEVGGDNVTLTGGTATFSDKNVGNGKTVTGTGFTLAGTDAGNYALASATLNANADITPRALTVSATGINKVYDGTTAATVTLSDDRVSGDDLTVDYAGASFADPNVGTGKPVSVSGICLNGADAGNYSFNTTASASADITPRSITVTADPQTKVYGDADPALTYQITAGSLVAGDAFTGALTRDAGENVGVYVISQGTLALSSNYSLSFNGASLSITARAVTVTADAKSKVYGDNDPSLTYQITSGSLAFTDTFSGSLARTAGENVGTYAILQGTLSLGGNYNLSFVGASFDITRRAVTVTADPQTKTYGDADPALTYQITNGSLVSGDMFSGGLTRVAGVDVGTYAIQQGTLALSSNYELTFVGANLTITARAITVTADAQAKTYGDSDPGLTYQITAGSLVGTDAFTGALIRDAGENVGAYAIQQGTLALSSNYVLTFVGNNLTINARAITVTADAKAKVYGDGDPALTYQITSGSLAFSDTFTGALSRAAGENVGAYAIGQGTLALNANYALSFVGADLTITARPVEVTANAGQSKVYGGADPAAFTYSVTAGSLAFSDAFTGALTRAAGENVGSYAINQGTLSLGSNYNLTYVGDNFAITKAALTITAQPNTKTYDGTDSAAAVPTVSGLQFTDTVTGLVEVYDNRNAGTGKTLSVSAYTVNDGNSGDNYAVTTVADTTGVINKAALTITAQPNTKTYDGNINAATTPSVNGLQGSDTVTGLAETYDTKHAGTGKTLSVSAYIVNDGNSGNNYTVSTVNDTTGVINKAPLTITAQPNTKTYDGTDSAAAAPVVVGAQGSDTVTGLAEAYDTKHVGTGKTLSVTAYTVNDGNGGNNYTVSTVNNTAGVINKRAITVTAVASTKIYDGTTSSSGTPTVTSGSIAVGDTGNFTQTFDTPLVGTGKTLTPAGSVSDGNAGNNYQITFAPAALGTITTGYCFNGFLSPIGGSVETLNGGSFADPVRAFKLGSTIPVKFALNSWNGTACGNAVTTGIHTLQAVKYNNAVDSETPIDASPTDAATTGNLFRLTDSQWHFNLSTKAGFSQGTWLLKATLQDGSIHTVWVTIKK